MLVTLALALVVPTGLDLLSTDLPSCDTFDQVQSETGGFSTVVGGPTAFEKAQTFVVGKTGMLKAVQLYRSVIFTGPGTLTVDVRATTGGVPVESNTALVTASISLSTFPTSRFIFVDLSHGNLQVAPGDVLAIALRITGRVTGEAQIAWYGGSRNPYPDGGQFFRSSQQPTWALINGGSSDVFFRTVVCSALVPDRWLRATLRGLFGETLGRFLVAGPHGVKARPRRRK